MWRKPLPSGRTAHKAAVARSVLTKAITSPRGDHAGTPTAASGSVSKVIGRVADPSVRAIHRFECPPVSDTNTTSRSSGLADGTWT